MICRQEKITDITRKTINKIQLDKLNAVLKREKERQGFYRDLPERLESLDDLKTLPFTTESDLAQKGGRMLLCSQGEIQRIISEQTSGTTGAGKRVFYTEGDCEHTIELFMAGLGEFIYPGSRTMVAMPFSGPSGLGELIADLCRYADSTAFHAQNVWKRQYKESTDIRGCLSGNSNESNRKNFGNTTLASLWFQRDGTWGCDLLSGS